MKKNITTKTIVAFFSMSAIVLGSTYSDLKFKTPDFMNDQEIKISKRLDDAERSIASFESKNPATLWFPLNENNKAKVNGVWNVFRFVDASDNIETLNAKIKFELIGNGKVRLNNDNEQIFNLSLYTGSTIAIWKRVEGGFEILEAKKIAVKKISKDTVVNNKSPAVVLDESIELTLRGAINNKLHKGIIDGNMIEGSAVLKSGMIEDFKVVLFKGTDKEVEESFIVASTENGVLTTADFGDEDVHGLVHNENNGSYKITISTGKLAGTIFNFVISSSVMEISEEESARREERALVEQEEAPVLDNQKEEVVQVQADFVDARKETAALSVEEMKVAAEENGFKMNSQPEVITE